MIIQKVVRLSLSRQKIRLAYRCEVFIPLILSQTSPILNRLAYFEVLSGSLVTSHSLYNLLRCLSHSSLVWDDSSLHSDMNP